MLIGKAELCSLIPHAGNMCLLESVLEWDAGEIHCTATSHTDPGNPLRRNGRLASIHLLEYGAQAMAIHSRLLARDAAARPLPGYLAAVRNVMLQEEFIDHITGPLQVHALLIATVTDSFMYRFTITGKHALLASARATVSVHRNATP